MVETIPVRRSAPAPVATTAAGSPERAHPTRPLSSEASSSRMQRLRALQQMLAEPRRRTELQRVGLLVKRDPHPEVGGDEAVRPLQPQDAVGATR